MQAFDRSGLDTCVQQRGSWTVGTGVNRPPSAVSVTPSSGGGWNQTFSFRFSDPDGAADLRYEFVLINQELRGDRACLLHYDGVRLWMVNDDGTGWTGHAHAGSATTYPAGKCGWHPTTLPDGSGQVRWAAGTPSRTASAESTSGSPQ